jgi:single-strand DNA-binding protein
MYLNEVRLLGRLTRDPEVRFTAARTAIANFGFALNRKFKDSQGVPQEHVTFVEIEAWAATAETLTKYVRKGDPLFIAGRLVLDEWNDKTTGQKRQRLKVVCEGFQFLPTGRSAGAPAESAPAPVPTTTTTLNPPAPPDDIPF